MSDRMTPPLLRLRPSHVMFSRESIKQDTIVETFRQLVNGATNVDEVSPLKVVRYQSKYWAHSGNRLLYVFRKMEEFGLIDTISVAVLPCEPEDINFCSNILSTDRGGTDVTIRGPGGSRMADTLALIHRKSLLRHNVGSTTAHQLNSKRRPLLNLKAKTFKHSENLLLKPPPSPYPRSPALIEHLLPYCVIVFFVCIALVFVILLSMPL